MDTSRRWRAQAQLAASLNNLEHALAGDPALAQLGKFTCPEVGSMSNDMAIKSLAQDLELAMEELIQVRIPTRRRSKEDRTQKAKCVVENWIKKSYPFVTLVLKIAKEGSSVR